MCWTYADEDFVGKVAQVALASSYGRGPLKLGPNLMERYLMAIALRIHRRRKFRNVTSNVCG